MLAVAFRVRTQAVIWQSDTVTPQRVHVEANLTLDTLVLIRKDLAVRVHKLTYTSFLIHNKISLTFYTSLIGPFLNTVEIFECANARAIVFLIGGLADLAFVTVQV